MQPRITEWKGIITEDTDEIQIELPTYKSETPEKEIPGFEAVLAITGLLAVAYLLRRNR